MAKKTLSQQLEEIKIKNEELENQNKKYKAEVPQLKGERDGVRSANRELNNKVSSLERRLERGEVESKKVEIERDTYKELILGLIRR